MIDGPGINDDGSGVAALLEIARALGGTAARATIRLAFWSGEEIGLHGSVRYASALSTEDARAILVYANVDMIASPNGFAGVYDEPGAPAGSAAARALLASAVERAGGAPVGVRPGRRIRPLRVRQGRRGHRRGLLRRLRAGLRGAGRHVRRGRRPARRAPATTQPCDDVANANLRLARVLAAGLADFTVRVANNPELLVH